MVSFFDLYADPVTGAISPAEALKIVSIAAASDDEVDRTAGRFGGCLRDIYGSLGGRGTPPTAVSKEMLGEILDVSPGILMEFRDGIVEKLEEERRLIILAKQEVCLCLFY